MDAEIPRMSRELIITELTDPTDRAPGTAPRAYSMVFSVPKANGSRRFILTCKPNPVLDCPTFKMSTLPAILPLLRRNDWMTSVDLTSAFSFVPLHPVTQPLLSFVYRGRHFQFTAMPFGLNSAPRTFTEMLRPVLAHMMQVFPGLRAWAYIDDLLIAHRSRATTAAATAELQALLASLGFEVNVKKSQVIPSHVITYLGFVLDTKDMTVSLPGSKKKSLSRLIANWLSPTHSPSIRELASLVGLLNSVRPAVPSALLFSGALQAARTAAKAVPRTLWDSPLPPLPPTAWRELAWWRELLSTPGRISAPMQPPPPTVILETDASFTGGGWVARRAPPGTTSSAIPADREDLPIIAQGGWFWPTAVVQASSSICDLELLAVIWAVNSAPDVLRGQSVLLLCDNFATTRYVTKGRGRVELLRDLTRDLHSALQAAQVRHLASVHLPGHLNRDADRLSRAVKDPTDWKLDPAVFEAAAARWGRPTTDLFASPANAQTPRFFSKGRTPGAASSDAFLEPWTGHSWANPPYTTKVISLMLAKVIREKARLTVCLPDWPSAPWRSTLDALTLDAFVVPKGTPGLFRPGHLGSEIISGPSRWPTIIALISGARWRGSGTSPPGTPMPSSPPSPAPSAPPSV